MLAKVELNEKTNVSLCRQIRSIHYGYDLSNQSFSLLISFFRFVSQDTFIYHLITMLASKLLFRFAVLVISLSTIIMVDALAGRCYLCSQATLAECVGNIEVDSTLFASVLQYYTEPCNGQCVLFRDENRSIVRGCSWTYGHMTDKSTGWHELSTGIRAYFCDTNLCNNGTYDDPDTSMIRTGNIQTQYDYTPSLTMSPQQLFVIAGNPGKRRQTK